MLATKAAPLGRAPFLAWWNAGVHRLALVAHQREHGDEALPGDVAQLLHAMAARAIGLVLRDDPIYPVLAVNVATGEPGQAPAAVWDRAAAGMQLTPRQGAALALLQRALRRAQGRAGERCHEIVQAAIDRPWDPDAQWGVPRRLEAALLEGRLAAVPAMVAAHVALLDPWQLANAYSLCWPWFPSMTLILEACDRAREKARSKGSGATSEAAAAAAAADGAGGAPADPGAGAAGTGAGAAAAGAQPTGRPPIGGGRRDRQG